MAEQNTKAERLVELDILRAFAVVAVILIHVVSTALYSFNHNSLAFKIYLSIDQFCRFCVPLFVALSGYSLALRYANQKINLKEFFQKRVFRILPWYFFASFAIIAYLKLTNSPEYDSKMPLWRIIFLGKADYHLYFVPMIFQLYLLFPILLFFWRKLGIKILAGVFIFQLAFYYLLTLVSLQKINIGLFITDQDQYLIFASWIFYFLLGITLRFLGHVPKLLKKVAVLILTLSFIWVLFDCFSTIYTSHDLIVTTRSTRIPILFYASAFFTVSIFYGQNLLNLPKKLVAILSELGKRSYVIYLLHTIVLRIFTAYIHLSTNFSIVFIVIATIITSNYLAEIAISTAGFLNPKIKPSDQLV